MRIPLPPNAVDNFNSGLKFGGTMMQNAQQMYQQAQLEKARQAQQNSQFQQNYGLDLQKFHAMQAQQAQDLAIRKALEAAELTKYSDAHKDELGKAAFMQHLHNIIRQGGQSGNTAQPMSLTPTDTGSMSSMPALQSLTADQFASGNMAQPDQQQPQQQSNPFNSLSPEDRLDASIYGIKLPSGAESETPEQKAALEIQTKNQENQDKEVAKANQKSISDIEADAPMVLQQILDTNTMNKLIKKRPDVFHPQDLNPFSGSDFHLAGGEFGSNFSHDPDIGDFQQAQNRMVTRAAHDLNSKTTNLQYKTQLAYKPGFNDTPEKAQGKVNSINKINANILQQQINKYKRLTGRNLLDDTYEGGVKLVEAPDGSYIPMSQKEFDRRAGVNKDG